jgi:hypothetical protein
MPYYILYPKDHKKDVKIMNKKPSARGNSKTFGFAEGPLKNKEKVCSRLNMMDVPVSRRPDNFKCPITAKKKMIFVLQGTYGHGREDLTAEETREEIRQRLKEYRENEGGNYRIVRKRDE